MTLPKDRVAYSAIVDRPPLKLPNDARVAVWTIGDFPFATAA